MTLKSAIEKRKMAYINMTHIKFKDIKLILKFPYLCFDLISFTKLFDDDVEGGEL